MKAIGRTMLFIGLTLLGVIAAPLAAMVFLSRWALEQIEDAWDSL